MQSFDKAMFLLFAFAITLLLGLFFYGMSQQSDCRTKAIAAKYPAAEIQIICGR